MKKEYIFVILIIIMLYMMYLTISYKYNEYRINSRIEQLYQNNEKISLRIRDKIGEIEYKSTKAYKNRVLKEDQWLKNKGEKVIYLITEKKYDIYTKKTVEPEIENVIFSEEESTVSTMTIFEKWIFFLFGKDIR